MKSILLTTAVLAALTVSGCSTSAEIATETPAASEVGQSDAITALLGYLQEQNTTGFIVRRDGETLIEKTWPAHDVENFPLFLYGNAPDGSLYEDVASQQKSFIAVLVGIAVDKGLIDVDRPVSDYLGEGWSKASPEQEARIKVSHILQMSSGLGEDFSFEADAGTSFFYNTPVYAVSKKILVAASGMTLEEVTRDWLTEPAGMADTAWRKRPAAFANVGNNTALVTTPSDIARFGQLILNKGLASSGERVVSEDSLAAMFVPSGPNPAYGQLWWLNGSDFTLIAGRGRKEGPLIASAPDDLVAALGFLDRKLYVVPSLDMVVVRTGADAPDVDFDAQVWTLLRQAGLLD